MSLALEVHMAKDLGLSNAQLEVLSDYFAEETKVRYKEVMQMDRIAVIKLVSHLLNYKHDRSVNR